MSRIAGLVVLAVLMALVAAFPAGAVVPPPPKPAMETGTGGAAATVDPYATQAAIDVLNSGGNAVDAAIAAAGVLGVVEPFSCGIGGGGFMVVYDARRNKVDTIDSRETAPAGMTENTFEGLPFEEARVGGLSVGVPGTVRGWETALKRYGTRSLSSLLLPGQQLADEGFVVDETFSAQTEANKAIFDDFTSTRELYLPAGDAPDEGATLRNPDMARTYERIRANPDNFYTGAIARDIAQTVQHPPRAPDSDRPQAQVHPGTMTPRDLAAYEALRRKPTRVNYRGLDVFGMGPPSSGGSTVGEALNILEGFSPLGDTRDQALHRYLEASKLAFADRGEYLGDPKYVYVPLRGLLSDAFAAERGSLITERALPTVPPQTAGNPYPYDTGGRGKPRPRRRSSGREGKSTTHLTVADRFGNIVSYTFTIESTGGSGIVVPGRGFLLNNELTDFNFAPDTANSPAPGKRPRSSMAPTIVFDRGRPAVALGSPGGSMIPTTVLQILVNHLDLGQSLPAAIAEPRASQRNTPTVVAEPAFPAQDRALLEARGHTFSSTAEIGAATGIDFLPDGRQQAVAEPDRRGGGAARVVRPD